MFSETQYKKGRIIMTDTNTIDTLKAIYASTAAIRAQLPADGETEDRDLDGILFHEKNMLQKSLDAVRTLLAAQAALHIQDSLRILCPGPGCNHESLNQLIVDLVMSDRAPDLEENGIVSAAANRITREPGDKANNAPYEKLIDILWTANINAVSGNVEQALERCSTAIDQIEKGAFDPGAIFAVVYRQIKRSRDALRAILELGV